MPDPCGTLSCYCCCGNIVNNLIKAHLLWLNSAKGFRERGAKGNAHALRQQQEWRSNCGRTPQAIAVASATRGGRQPQLQYGSIWSCRERCGNSLSDWNHLARVELLTAKGTPTSSPLPPLRVLLFMRLLLPTSSVHFFCPLLLPLLLIVLPLPSP